MLGTPVHAFECQTLARRERRLRRPEGSLHLAPHLARVARAEEAARAQTARAIRKLKTSIMDALVMSLDVKQLEPEFQKLGLTHVYASKGL